MTVRVKKKMRDGITVMVVSREDVEKLRAANRRTYQKRIEQNKNARANVATRRCMLNAF